MKLLENLCSHNGDAEDHVNLYINLVLLKNFSEPLINSVSLSV